MVPPRIVPDRDDYYMGCAWLASRKSKDPRTQIGAYIISSNNVPISAAYNGPPAAIDDTAINWDRPYKYPFIHHAESNAIWWGRHTCMNGASIYVTGPPCKACMLDIVRSGIQQVIYYPQRCDPDSLLANAEEWRISQEIAALGNIKLKKFAGSINWISSDISEGNFLQT